MHFIEEIENERKKIAKIFYILMPISGVLVTAGIICLLFSKNSEDPLRGVFGWGIILAVLLFILSLNIPRKKFDKLIRNRLGGEIINDAYKDMKIKYVPKNGIGFNEMNASGLFQKPDEFKTSDTVVGSYKDVEFISTSYVFTKYETRTDGKSTRTEKKDYPGRYFIFHLERNVGNGIHIAEKINNYVVTKLKLYKEKVQFESMEINKKFHVYTDDKEKSFYIIRPKEIVDIIDIEKKYRGQISIVFKGNYCYFLIDGAETSLGSNFLKKFDEKAYENLVEFYRVPLRIIDKLGLEKGKFNNTEIDE